ncbi:WD repeat-containing protein 37-like protein [Leptotrombidium deliense]|uniref:WD repeat-containing protein 37-like protein n=1 Tax=Leptotrombidium deliense TaxID=299467 RepID=A0A443RZM9_9ACAR|nr:WD repeat-containing protein 37-like protein [Leptotrombidium deliense]
MLHALICFSVKDRVDALEEVIITSSGTPPSESTSTKLLQQKLSGNIKRDSMVAASHISQKIKSTYKLKTQGRIFNKTQSNMRGTLLEKYEWHKDGVWFVTTCVSENKLFVGTASADGSACIADVTNSGSIATPHITYTGHEGCSVNCIRFHPKYGLVITASGDSGAHIWAPELHKVNINDAIDV